MAFLVCGPAGMEVIGRALEGFEWIVPDRPASFPDGWAPDPEAFRSGLGFSTDELPHSELQKLEEWYTRRLGEIPPYVAA